MSNPRLAELARLGLPPPSVSFGSGLIKTFASVITVCNIVLCLFVFFFFNGCAGCTECICCTRHRRAVHGKKKTSRAVSTRIIIYIFTGALADSTLWILFLTNNTTMNMRLILKCVAVACGMFVLVEVAFAITLARVEASLIGPSALTVSTMMYWCCMVLAFVAVSLSVATLEPFDLDPMLQAKVTISISIVAIFGVVVWLGLGLKWLYRHFSEMPEMHTPWHFLFYLMLSVCQGTFFLIMMACKLNCFLRKDVFDCTISYMIDTSNKLTFSIWATTTIFKFSRISEWCPKSRLLGTKGTAMEPRSEPDALVRADESADETADGVYMGESCELITAEV